MSDDPIDDRNAPRPTTDPEVDPRPGSRGDLPPARVRVGVGVGNAALLAIVFVATLLLLLGASRLLDRGAVRPSSGAVASTPSISHGPLPSESPVPSASAERGDSGDPGDSTDPGSGGPAATATPTSTGDPVLVGAGDIGHCASSGDEATAALLDTIEGTVFTAGDNAYGTGTADEFRECYQPSWGRHLDRTRPAPGDNDWDTAGLAGYLGYFGDAARGSDGSSWYSYDLGAWHVIVLDSTCHKAGGCDAASAQGQWLARDLDASDARCTLAIFHHPRFSSGAHGDTPEMDAFWQPLYAAGVDVVVNGHDHDYERFDLQDPDGRLDGDRGIRQFVVGTGGAPLRDFTRVAPNSELRVVLGHGVIAFTLLDGSYEWEFTVAGTAFSDRGTTPCH